MILLILLALIPKIFASRFPFAEYTHVARTFGGSPCLTGCDSNFECVLNWGWQKGNCRTFELAPVYLTARVKDPLRKYCLSNCGYFGEKYEWCITTEDLKWDFCSSLPSITFLPSLEPTAHTRFGVDCNNECRWTERYPYYWCYFTDGNMTSWEYCAPPAMPRVPVLNDRFSIGEKKKGNCDGFLKYNLLSPNNLTAIDAADHFVTEIAEAIEATGINNKQTKKFIVTDGPIESYTMIKIGDLSVPAVIRAHITNDSIAVEGESTVSEAVDRKLRKQMADSNSSFEDVQLIGARLGGPNAEYNMVPRSVNWECDEWWAMELAVKRWCRTTGGSVDMTVVVFYMDENTAIPQAFGVSLVYRDSDHSVFVDCREKIHYNYF